MYLLVQPYQLESHHSTRYWELLLYFEENYRRGILVMGFPEVISFICSTQTRNSTLKTNSKQKTEVSILLPRILRCLNNVFLAIWFFTFQAFFQHPCC